MKMILHATTLIIFVILNVHGQISFGQKKKLSAPYVTGQVIGSHYSLKTVMNLCSKQFPSMAKRYYKTLSDWQKRNRRSINYTNTWFTKNMSTKDERAFLASLKIKLINTHTRQFSEMSPNYKKQFCQSVAKRMVNTNLDIKVRIPHIYRYIINNPL